jgi:hypothetical protein
MIYDASPQLNAEIADQDELLKEILADSDRAVRALQEQLDARPYAQMHPRSADVNELQAKLERQAEAMQQVKSALAAERTVAKAAARKHTASLIMCRAALRAAQNKASNLTTQLHAQQPAAVEATAESTSACHSAATVSSSKEQCDELTTHDEQRATPPGKGCLITQFKAARLQAQKARQERRQQIQQLEAAVEC